MRHALLILGGVASLSAPTLAVEAGEGGGGGLGEALISPNPGIFIWTLITFIIVVFVLRHFAWGPLLGALETRENSIRDTLGQAQKDREQASELLEEHRQMLAEARRERAEALERGQREADRLKDEILTEARGQREQMLEQTQAQIDTAMRQARSEVRDMVVDLSIRAAEKVMAKSLDESTHRRLVEDYLSDLDRNGSAGSPSA